MGWFKRWFDDSQIDLAKIEAYAAGRLRGLTIAGIGLLVFVGAIALISFAIAVRGAEQTMVPDVAGKELTQALLELQAKELYPRIQLRYSQTAADKGAILEQDPPAGAIVKAGRRIKLVVSRGVVVDKVENFIGQNLNDVKNHLQTLFATAARPLLTLKEPPMYRFSAEPAGTVLAQQPEAEYEITGPTQLEFVVSRGPENSMAKVPDLVGLPLADALDRIGSAGVTFAFTVRPAQGKEKPETILAQLPAAAAVVAANTVLALTVAAPAEVPAGEVFGLFEYELPEFPYPLAIKLESLSAAGVRTPLLAMKHPGGRLSVPYHVAEGSTLILSVLKEEKVRRPAVPFVPAE